MDNSNYLLMGIILLVILGTLPSILAEDSIPISEKIKNNTKFDGFEDHVLKAFDNGELDEYFLRIAVSIYVFDFSTEAELKERVDKLVDVLKNVHGVEELSISRAGVRALVPIQEIPKLVEYDFVKQVSGASGFGFKYFTEDQSEGLFKINHKGHLYDLPYSNTNGKIIHYTYFGFALETFGDGKLEISIPRELIDPVDSYGKLINYWQSSPLTGHRDLEISCEYRTMEFSYNDSQKFSVGFYGNLVTANEDPRRDAWFRSLPEDRFNFSIDERQFEIITRQNGAICNLDFIPEEHSINIKLNGKTATTDSIQVIIPKHVLDGDFQVSVDGKEVDFKHVKSELYNKLTLDHTFDNNHIINIEIVGTDLFTHDMPKPDNSFVSVVTDKKVYKHKNSIQVFGFASEPEEYALVDYVNVELINPNDQIVHGPWSLSPDSNQIFYHEIYVNSLESGIIPGEYILHAYYPEYDDKTTITIVDEFSSNLLIGTPEFVDSLGKPLDFVRGKMGMLRVLNQNQIQISTNVTNQNPTLEQPFVYQLDVKRLDAFDDFTPQWITGNLEANQTLNVAMSWIPKTSGLYAVSVSIGTESGNPIDAITKIITVGNSSISVLPNWVKNDARWWADGQISNAAFLKNIKLLVDSKMINIHSVPEQNSTTAIIPEWIKNNAKWWSEGSISEQAYVEGIKYLIEHGIIQIS